MKELAKHVYLFYPNEDQITQKTIDDVYLNSESGQFSSFHYAFLFLPGVYHITLKIGFYTEAIGLGEQKEDVCIDKLWVDAKWLHPGNALCNFYRSVSNMRVVEDSLWAISQATSMRRMVFDHSLYLSEEQGSASGGFISQTIVKERIYSRSQQQFFLRNSLFQAFIGENWNMVFVGCKNTPKMTWPNRAYTVEQKTPKMIEKPYWFYRDNTFYLRTFSFVENTIGLQEESYQDIPISEFQIISSDCDLSGLRESKYMLFLPGEYSLPNTLYFTLSQQIVYGLGLPAISSFTKKVMVVKGEENILTGILLEAKHQEVLLEIEETTSSSYSLFSDIYARVGGKSEENTSLDTAILNHRSNVIFDHLWLWRADHSFGVGLEKNKAKHGLVTYGDSVYLYGIFVEHFLEYQTVFYGEDNHLFFYQSETPYEFLTQDQYYDQKRNKNGFASYVVEDTVKHHEAKGLGIYSVFLKAPVWLDSCILVPESPGIKIYHAMSIELGPNPGIHHIINETGEKVENTRKQYVLEYPIHPFIMKYLLAHEISVQDFLIQKETYAKDGVITSLPASWPKKLNLFVLIYPFLSEGKIYTEKEITNIITLLYPKDAVEFRRGLVDSKILSRTENGKDYWVKIYE